MRALFGAGVEAQVQAKLLESNVALVDFRVSLRNQPSCQQQNAKKDARRHVMVRFTSMSSDQGSNEDGRVKQYPGDTRMQY